MTHETNDGSQTSLYVEGLTQVLYFIANQFLHDFFCMVPPCKKRPKCISRSRRSILRKCNIQPLKYAIRFSSASHFLACVFPIESYLYECQCQSHDVAAAKTLSREEPVGDTSCTFPSCVKAFIIQRRLLVTRASFTEIVDNRNYLVSRVNSLSLRREKRDFRVTSIARANFLVEHFRAARKVHDNIHERKSLDTTRRDATSFVRKIRKIRDARLLFSATNGQASVSKGHVSSHQADVS